MRQKISIKIKCDGMTSFIPIKAKDSTYPFIKIYHGREFIKFTIKKDDVTLETTNCFTQLFNKPNLIKYHLTISNDITELSSFMFLYDYNCYTDYNGIIINNNIDIEKIIKDSGGLITCDYL